MMKMMNIITIELGRYYIKMYDSITQSINIVDREYNELFNYLTNYVDRLPLVNIKSILGKSDNRLPKQNTVYIRERDKGTYYVIKDKMDGISLSYLRAQPDYKFEEFDVPVLEVNRDYYELYSMTLGKELATIACILDMPPEIACLLEEV